MDSVVSVVSAAEINDFLERDFPGNGNRCDQVGDGWAVAPMRTPTGSTCAPAASSAVTVFGVCDAALYYACFTRIGIEPMTLTSELSIRFLRPARGSELRARAPTCTRWGDGRSSARSWPGPTTGPSPSPWRRARTCGPSA